MGNVKYTWDKSEFDWANLAYLSINMRMPQYLHLGKKGKRRLRDYIKMIFSNLSLLIKMSYLRRSHVVYKTLIIVFLMI